MDNRPSSVWVIELHSEGILRMPGILSEMIEYCSETSTGWAGWGFLITGPDCTTGCLLFERREDAVMAKLVYGETLYAN